MRLVNEQADVSQWRAVVESERIKRLTREPNVREFWAEIERTGAPLVEELDDADGVCVTFLLRAGADSGPWTLCEGIAGASPAELELANVPGTDIWHISLRLPRDTRVTYGFSPDQDLQLKNGDFNWPLHFASRRSDPYNPRTYRYSANGDVPGPWGRTVSVLELPDAPSQRWSVPLSRPTESTITRHELPNPALGRTTEVYVYTPGHRSLTEQTPLVVLFDGWQYVELGSIATVFDNVIAAGGVPPFVAVMPESGEHRIEELYFSDDYCAFVAGELVRWAEREWSVGSRRERNVIGGASLGGLAALYTGLRHGDVFGNVMSQIGAVGTPRDGERDWLLRQYVESAPLPLRIYQEAGLLDNDTFPGVTPLFPDKPPMLDANRRLHEALMAGGYDTTYREVAGGHDWVGIRETVGDALVELLGPSERTTDEH
jgi:enterochelin esterase-like enzyme